MSVMNFVEEAGEDLLRLEQGTRNSSAAQTASAGTANVSQANAAAGAAIARYVKSQTLYADNLNIIYDFASKTVTITGVAPDEATKEKIALCCGNVRSVAKVDDRITVARPATASTFYDVERDDSLPRIAKVVYGDANAYPKLVDANRPMLMAPDKIYPGQKLRIPL